MKYSLPEDRKLKLKDGVDLISRVWKPKSIGPWPALLMRQPYGRAIGSTVTYPHPEWWSQKGYLVVIQDVRGLGDSQGKFTGFDQEASDTSETHNWVRSLPECNGKIGTYGFSYQGLSQLIATKGTKAPDCMVPAMTGLDECNHWSCDGNAFWWHLGISWGLQLAALKARKEENKEVWNLLRNSLTDGSYLKDGHLLLEKHDPEGMAYKWFSKSNKTSAEWTIHEPLKEWLKQPILLIGGWWDPHLNGIIDIYKRSIKAGGKPELHIGPATHLEWWDGVHELQLRFFNKHLKDSDEGENTGQKGKLWNISTKEWQDIKNRSASIQSWGLKSQGLACAEINEGSLNPVEKGSGLIQLVHDPWRPVPSRGGHLGPEAGLVDRENLDKRCDVACFTSSPFKSRTEFEGYPVLELEVISDQDGFDLCIALSVINENQSRVTQISTGFQRILGSEPFSPIRKKVILQPILFEVKTNERIRLSIAGSAWPAIGVNPGNSLKGVAGPEKHCNIITQTINLNNSKFQILPFFN